MLETIDVMLEKGAFLPERAHTLDAGYDLRSRTTRDTPIPPHGSAIFNTGVHMAIPAGYVGLLKSKSGLNVKNGITGEGVIDAGYTGYIIVKLYNDTDKPYYVINGDKIIQIIIIKAETPTLRVVDSFRDTERGDSGFGSSGR